jgi:CubicO group peptidase (beta-lactamase class C family)
MPRFHRDRNRDLALALLLGALTASATTPPSSAAAAPAIRSIAASATDPAIADLLGQHAVAVGAPGARLGRLLVLYPGTGATADRYSLFLTRAAELGYHAIGLAYDNRDAINWDICPGQPDRCYEDARLEILLGIESGYTPPSVDVDNSAFNRLTKLLSYLHGRYPDEGWDAYLAGDGPRWDRIAFAGHSQGGGHAAMTAKLHEVARAILFDATEPKAWTAAAFATSADRLYGFAHELEPIFAPITRSWANLGLPGELTNVDASPPPFGGAHRLSTATGACRGDPASAGYHHNCPVVDDYTPLDPDGNPSLRYVWDVLLEPGPRRPAATVTAPTPAPATDTPAPPAPTVPPARRALFLPLALAGSRLPGPPAPPTTPLPTTPPPAATAPEATLTPAAVTPPPSVTPGAVSPEELARYREAADYSASVQGEALVIARAGQLVFEDYVGAMTADTPHMLASGTKSFSAALFALGAADGLWTLDERVADTLTEWRDDPRRGRITVRHLLTLTSGLEDAPEYSATNVRGLDTYDLAINHSVSRAEPGAACIYAATSFQVLAALFERKAGGVDPARYLYDRLLVDLGFDRAHLDLWTRDRLGKPQMAGGAFLTAREWLSYGLLWQQGGRWAGRQLLDPALIDHAVTYDNPAFRGYGLTWWLNLDTTGTYDPGEDQIPADARGDGNRIASNAPADLFMAAGAAKQRLYVLPSAGLVVVRFGRSLRNDAWSDHVLLGKLLGVP